MAQLSTVSHNVALTAAAASTTPASVSVQPQSLRPSVWRKLVFRIRGNRRAALSGLHGAADLRAVMLKRNMSDSRLGVRRVRTHTYTQYHSSHYRNISSTCVNHSLALSLSLSLSDSLYKEPYTLF